MVILRQKYYTNPAMMAMKKAGTVGSGKMGFGASFNPVSSGFKVSTPKKPVINGMSTNPLNSTTIPTSQKMKSGDIVGMVGSDAAKGITNNSEGMSTMSKVGIGAGATLLGTGLLLHNNLNSGADAVKSGY